MTGQHKVVVFGNDIGVVLDVTSENAADEIAAARKFLAQIGSGSPRRRVGTTQRAETLSARIMELGADYFSQPKESADVGKDLARAAHHYKDTRIRVELSRLVRRARLRRIGDGTKLSPYRYVNP
jgi:hypothetical protein